MEAPVIVALSILGLVLLIVIPVLIQWYRRHKKEQKRLRLENILETVIRIENNFYRPRDNENKLMAEHHTYTTRRMLRVELGKYFREYLFTTLIEKPNCRKIIDNEKYYKPHKVIEAIWKSTKES